MTFFTEFLENLSAVAPGLLTILLIWRNPRGLSGWAMALIGSSFLASISIGLLISRLIQSCPPVAATCEASTLALNRIPGIFTSCSVCSVGTPSKITLMLNQSALPLQAGTALICLLLSFTTLIRFAIWTKKICSSPRR